MSAQRADAAAAVDLESTEVHEGSKRRRYQVANVRSASDATGGLPPGRAGNPFRPEGRLISTPEQLAHASRLCNRGRSAEEILPLIHIRGPAILFMSGSGSELGTGATVRQASRRASGPTWPLTSNRALA